MTMRTVELFHLFRRAFAGLAVLVLIVLSIVVLLQESVLNKETELVGGLVLMFCAIGVALTLREETRLYKQSLKAGESLKELTDHLKSV